jgi:hypothetical protein
MRARLCDSSRVRGTLTSVDPATDIAEPLTTRGAKVTPEQAGLPFLELNYETMEPSADDGLSMAMDPESVNPC